MSRSVSPFKGFPNTYLNEGIEIGVVGHNGYLRAIKAHLIINFIFKFYEYIRILMESGVFIVIVILWLGAGQLMFSTICLHDYLKSNQGIQLMHLNE